MYYVDLLESEAAGRQRYVGLTSDLKQRIPQHNAGKSTHRSKYLPWKLVTYVAFTNTYVAFTNKQKAELFERYLKSGSGHAFAGKRLWKNGT